MALSHITRFAPSPTGHLHIGGARTALFCWAFAKRYGGKFLLRIEDTDAARSSEESARGIMEDLAWLGIDWDEGPVLKYETSGNTAAPQARPTRTIGGDPRGVGPFFQAQRLAKYNDAIMRLVELGRAYPAFETSEELEAQRRVVVAAKQTYRYDRASYNKVPDIAERIRRMNAGEPHVVRFYAPHEPIVVVDQVLGDVKTAAGELDDFVIRKQDGLPTYHFAVVCDDEAMGVTHVLRAQEHLANTPRHVALQKALGFRTPNYAHMPLIFNVDGTKMSKRDKAKFARKSLKDAIAKNGPDFIASVVAATHVDEKSLKDFLAAENDSLDTAEKIAAHLKIALPEIEVADFRSSGYLPEAILCYVALLGWNPGLKLADGKDREKFTMTEIGEHFTVDRIGKTNSKFDRAKLLAFNADYVAQLPDDQFAQRWWAWCIEEKDSAEDVRTLVSKFTDASHAASPAKPIAAFALLATAVKPRAKTFRDAVKSSKFALLTDDLQIDPAAREKNLNANNQQGLTLLREFLPLLQSQKPWHAHELHALMEQFVKDKSLPNPGPIAQALRVALTGTSVSPGMGETLELIGRESVLARISRVVG
ncbi:glutamate--tRNA ligase [Phycisphaerae bacterium]|nr:glutamate--tRNA ligase [Phycisphaerae bacterium]